MSYLFARGSGLCHNCATEELLAYRRHLELIRVRGATIPGMSNLRLRKGGHARSDSTVGLRAIRCFDQCAALADDPAGYA